MSSEVKKNPRAVLLKVWFLDLQPQHYLEVSQKNKLSGTTPEPSTSGTQLSREYLLSFAYTSGSTPSCLGTHRSQLSGGDIKKSQEIKFTHNSTIYSYYLVYPNLCPCIIDIYNEKIYKQKSIKLLDCLLNFFFPHLRIVVDYLLQH